MKKGDIFNYGIYQQQNKEYLFMGSDFFTKKGMLIPKEGYEQVYCGSIKAYSDDINSILEALYYIFNCERPEDFKGHSMSVGDIIKIKNADETSIFFCDSFGFTKLTEEEKGYDV